MISDSYSKIIRSLIHKKYRDEHGIFIVEGKKAVIDMLNGGFTNIRNIFISDTCFEAHKNTLFPYQAYTQIMNEKGMKKISNLNSIPDIILIGEIPKLLEYTVDTFSAGIHVYLDRVQDPGNVGTIFRNAEWFGVRSIGLSHGCADFVHPKVIQASMGSFSRIAIYKGDFPFHFLDNVPILGATLDGKSLYETEFPSSGILLIGSEGQGISDDLLLKVRSKIKIPGFGKHIESINAANATAILLNEWRRQIS